MRPLFLLLLAANGYAGDRPLEILFANMTPDAASSKASKKCVQTLEKKIAGEDNLTRLGETALRKLAKKTNGEPFMSWPAGALQPAKEHTRIDVAILVDCRPEVGRLEVLVQPASGGLALFRVQKLPLDADFVVAAILRRAWAGFSP